MLNFVIIQGNLTFDPVLNKTKKGISVLSVRLACKRDVRGTNRDADFIRATFWGPQADYVAKYFKKGDNITVQGRIEEVPRVNKDGDSFTSLEIRVSNVQSGVTKEMRTLMQQASQVVDTE